MFSHILFIFRQCSEIIKWIYIIQIAGANNTLQHVANLGAVSSLKKEAVLSQYHSLSQTALNEIVIEGATSDFQKLG